MGLGLTQWFKCALLKTEETYNYKMLLIDCKMSIHRFTDDLDLQNDFEHICYELVFVCFPENTFQNHSNRSLQPFCPSILAPPTNPPYIPRGMQELVHAGKAVSAEEERQVKKQQNSVEGDLSQNKNPSKKQSIRIHMYIGETEDIARCITRTSTKHACRPADFFLHRLHSVST